MKFSKEVKKRRLRQIKFEFTAKNMTEQNGKVERDIATIWGRERSMMSAAHLPSGLRGKLWAELFRTAVDLLNVSSSIMGEKTRNEKRENRLPDSFLLKASSS